MRFAAIDIGTVTCRMLIADVELVDGSVSITPLDKQYAITNLGIGVDKTHVISSDAMDRVMTAIDRFIAVRNSFDTPVHPVVATTVMATSASRDAKNASEFEALLASRGLVLDIIPGAMEARLSFLGATYRLSSNARDTYGSGMSSDGANCAMVVDVGGGSTEITIGVSGAEILASKSFDIGCRRVTERYIKTDPPKDVEIAHACKWIHDQFAQWRDEIGFSALGKPSMIAVAGTATSAVSIRDHMEVYDSKLVDGQIVTCEELARITADLASLDLAEREKVAGLDPGRAPVIVAGMLILQEVMRVFGIDHFQVSESDILDGMIISAFEKY